jgi:uncharacterized RDD family membrane protein YckC
MAAQAQAAGDLSARAAHAGIVSRALALAIDAAIVQGSLVVAVALLTLIGQLVGGVHLGPVGQAIAAAGWLVLTGAYFAVSWAVDGQTLGMRAMRLAVQRSDGVPALSPARAVVRTLWLGLCILPAFLGFVTVLFDRRRRGVHDLIAGTVVVHVDA